MRKLFCAIALAACLGSANLSAQAYRVGVDPRIELMSILFRLAGSEEYTQCRVPSYLDAVERHFGPYRNHEAVQLARRLRETDGVSYDAVMSMAVYLTDATTLAERVPFDRPDLKLDQRWHGVKAGRFLEAARRFVADAHFAEFLKSQQPLYDTTNERLRAFVEAKGDLPWFTKFFGAKSAARFIIVPGLVNGPSSYGASIIAEDGTEELYAIPGVFETDVDGLPKFRGNWLETMVHEFVHSYSNPLIDEFSGSLEQAGMRLNEPLEAEMRSQGYGPWKTLLYESMVRAVAVRYAFDHDGPKAAERAVLHEQLRAFICTDELADLLGEYEKNRQTYPTLESFMPQVVKYFEGAAARVGVLIKRVDDLRPKIAKLSIENGSRDIDPRLTAIVVRFDRPMDTSAWAVAQRNPTQFPRVGRVSFDKTGMVFTIPVTLEADRDYEMALNWPGGGSFASEDGVPLKYVLLHFHTRPARPTVSKR